jgi:hypothetical protein
MSGFVVARRQYDSQIVWRVSGWERYYLRRAAPADVACAVVGVFATVQLRFGNNVTGTYMALSLAPPVLWLVAIWLAGGHDVRFIGTGSHEFRKILNAGDGRPHHGDRGLLIRSPQQGIPRLYITTAWLKRITTFRRQTCHGVVKVRSARASAWMGERG